MFRGGGLPVDETQGRTADQIKKAAEFDADRPQAPGSPVCTESFVKGSRFGQYQICLVGGKQAQAMPSAALSPAGFLQPRY